MESLQAAVNRMWDELSPAERAVCQHLLKAPPEQLLYARAQELGDISGTSSATVIRAVQRLGYSGLPGLKQEIAETFTSVVAPEVRLRQRIERVGDDIGAIVDQVFDEALERVEHCRSLVDLPAYGTALSILAAANDVFVYGVGASESAARQFALKLNRLGRRSRIVTSTGFSLADDLLPLAQGDAVVVFFPSRRLREFEVLTDRARAVGAGTILVSDRLARKLANRVDAALAAPNTTTGITSESLTELIVGDALVQALAAVDEKRSVTARHELTGLRDKLLGKDASTSRQSPTS
ncbi:MAG: SIS domain-containing protein [Streptosporangiales bacterium]|nr:SIS domain-containing protein [Streptosporangiales bacterium]